MQTIFSQLERIKTKDELHRWIDELPDDVELKGLILLDISGNSGEEEYHICARAVGHPTDMEKNFYLDVFKHNVIFGCGGPSEF